MQKHELDPQIRSLFGRVFKMPEDEILLTSDRNSIKTWDSLTQINLIVALEDAFDIEFSPEEIANMNSIKAIVDFLEDSSNA